jgi:hypothetical protein
MTSPVMHKSDWEEDKSILDLIIKSKGGYMKVSTYLLCLILIVAISFNYTDAVADPYGTPLGAFNGIVNFSNKGGSKIKDFLGWEYECVEYINRYYYEIYDYPSWKGHGDAKDYFRGLPKKYKDITAYENRGPTAPERGDIMVWGASPANKNKGHVAIVKDVQDTSVTVIQQNLRQNSEDANYILAMTHQDGKYKVSGGPGTVLGWLGTSKEPREITIIDDDNSVNEVARAGRCVQLSGYGAPATIRGWGYLNGHLRAPTILEDNVDPKKFVGMAWLSSDFIERTRVDIYAFIPEYSSKKRSKQASYDIGIYGPAGYVVEEYIVSNFDQSLVQDDWELLLEDIVIEKGGHLAIEADNKTGETGRYVIFDAIRIVAKP